MSSPPEHKALTGVLLMSTAMLMIPMVDGIAKHLSSAHSPLYISWARYAVACLFVLPFAIARHGKAFLPREQKGVHLLRTVFLVAAMNRGASGQPREAEENQASEHH